MSQDLAADSTTFDLTPPTPEQFDALVADLDEEEKRKSGEREDWDENDGSDDDEDSRPFLHIHLCVAVGRRSRHELERPGNDEPVHQLVSRRRQGARERPSS